jgi:cyclopropane fatty-acyl-phospholipid synthase-like methyltransferase
MGQNGGSSNETIFFPGDRHYTQEAGKLLELNSKHRVVVMLCGLSNAATIYAEEFGCRVTAFDVEPQRISASKDAATRRDISDLITFDLLDLKSADYPEHFFDVVSAEGGALGYLGHREGLAFARRVLRPGGYLIVSDYVFTSPNPPQEVRDFFEEDEEEDMLFVDEYLQLLTTEGFGVLRHTLATAKDWDDYYQQIKDELNSSSGRFANSSFARAMQEEIELYYQGGGQESVGYVVAVAKFFG